MNVLCFLSHPLLNFYLYLFIFKKRIYKYFFGLNYFLILEIGMSDFLVEQNLICQIEYTANTDYL